MSEYRTAQALTAARPTVTPITTGVLQRACACGQHNTSAGECEECTMRRQGVLQRAAINSSNITQEAPSIVHEVLRSPGRPLDEQTRAFMEKRLGQDFSNVRVHTDAKAVESAQAVNALAYTMGRDVVFGDGMPSLFNLKGRRLLAHELTHVVQQRGSSFPARSIAVGDVNDPSERQAEAAAVEVSASEHLLTMLPQDHSGFLHADSLSHRLIENGRARGNTLFAQPPRELKMIIRRQKATSDKTSGQPQLPRNKRLELEKRLQEPCLHERVDDTKAHCDFSAQQSILVRVVQQAALRRCFDAARAIDMPGNDGEVIRLAQDYFHLDILLTEEKRRELKNMIEGVSGKLENAPIECRTCQDENCNLGDIAFAEARVSMGLCPKFFHPEINPVPVLPGFLIHEAAHLAGINKRSRDEPYCHQGATKEQKCPVPDAFHNADAWSHFIEELSYTI